MSTQKARNTAAGMVRDALERLVEWDRVQDLRSFENTKEEATRLLDLAANALSYFEHHYDFPQEEETSKRYNVWLNDDCEWFPAGAMPIDGSGVSLAEAKREYCELVKEYSTRQLLILPADMEISNTDELGTIGGMFVVQKKAR